LGGGVGADGHRHVTLDGLCARQTQVGQEIIRRACHSVVARKFDKARHGEAKEQCHDTDRDNHLYQRKTSRHWLHGANYKVAIDSNGFDLTSGQIRAISGC
jgi:hypothetical protein